MAPQLDETITAGQTGHLSDHSQLHEKANYVYDVTDFGAVGDGTTDDSSAIQAAIDALEALANPPPLLFPVIGDAGQYLCNTGLVYDDIGIRIIGGGGQGRNEDPLTGASLIAGTNGMELLRINSTSTLIHPGPIIENINFVDESAAKTATLLRIHNILRWTVRNCTFRDASATGGIGLEITREAGGDNAWGIVDQCTFTALDVGLSAVASNGFTMVGGHFTGGQCVLDEDTQSVKIFGTKWDGDGILIQGASNSVQGATLENCTPGIDINDTGSGLRGKRNSIMGCDFTGSGTETGLAFTGTDPSDNQVFGPTFTNLATNVAYAGSRNQIRGHTRSGAQEISTSITLDWSHDIISGDASSTFTLPDCATYEGKSYLIQRDGGTVTIDVSGADTFKGGDTQKTLDTDGAAIRVYSIGTSEWKIAGTEGTVGGS